MHKLSDKIDRAVQKIKSLGGDKVRFITLYGSASEYRMKEVKHMREYNGDIRLIFYELPKFKKNRISNISEDLRKCNATPYPTTA